MSNETTELNENKGFFANISNYAYNTVSNFNKIDDKKIITETLKDMKILKTDLNKLKDIINYQDNNIQGGEYGTRSKKIKGILAGTLGLLNTYKNITSKSNNKEKNKLKENIEKLEERLNQEKKIKDEELQDEEDETKKMNIMMILK